MKNTGTLAVLLQRFFTGRLINQKRASKHTIASYRDTFRLLLKFVEEKKRRAPAEVAFEELDADLIVGFLGHCERHRDNGPSTRNLRLTAIRAFFRFVAFEEPAHSALIQRVLAIPSKRQTRRLIDFMTRTEIDALLAATDHQTWVGRRDHALLLVAIQTGLRVSELTGLKYSDVVLTTGAHVRCEGKGRKERSTPLAKHTVLVLNAWLAETRRSANDVLFPNATGGSLSTDAIQYMVRKYLAVAAAHCPSLSKKRITPHVLRHTAAMELLQAGVDTSLIALWLGHESVQTTQVYLSANLAIKEKILAKVEAVAGRSIGRYRPADTMLEFLKSL